MATVLVFEKEDMRIVCAYRPQIGRPDCEKDQFYEEIPCGWDLQNHAKMILGLEAFKRHDERQIDDFE